MASANLIPAPVDVVLVGCGHMGFALLSGWLTEDAGIRVHVVEPEDTLRRRAEALGALTASGPEALEAGLMPAVIVMAVKPQQMSALLPQYLPFTQAGTFFLSVAAGIDLAALQAALGGRVPVIRCMPNTPAAVGEGMLVCCAGPGITTAQRRIAEMLLLRIGIVRFIDDETLMDAVTAVSGSGPAYLFHFIECLAKAGVAGGLLPALAEELAMQTVYGASVLARRSDVSPALLRQQVTSPNGTTAAALKVLMRSNDGLEAILSEAVEAARMRSVALGMS